MANSHSVLFVRGSNQYAGIADGSQTGLDITGDISIECWIKLTQLPSTAGGLFQIVSKSKTSTPDRSFYFGIPSSSDKLFFIYYQNGDNSANSQVECTTAFTGSDVGVWRHVAVTVDVDTPANSLFYIDASVKTTNVIASNGSSIYDGTADFQVSGRDGGTAYFDGRINSLRVFSDIRSGAEISANWKTETPAGDNLQGSWYYNNDHADDSGNSNTLTASGTPTFDTDIPYPDAAAGVTTLIGGGIIQG